MNEEKTVPSKLQHQQWKIMGLEFRIPAEVFRLFRFSISGLVATVVYFLSLMLLIKFTYLRSDIASIAAYLIAIVLSYLLQSRYTFQMKTDSTYQIGSFIVISLMGLAISYFAMYILALKNGYSPILVAAAICIIIPVMNYTLFKYVIFRQNSPPGGKAHTNK